MKHEGQPKFENVPKGNPNILEDKNKVGMEMSEKFGRIIQERFPDIAIDYINGKLIPDIITEQNIMGEVGISNLSIAKVATLNAIKGTKNYKGLVTDTDVLRAIGEKHKTAGRSRAGTNVRAAGHGIFGMDPQRKSAISSANGKRMRNEGRAIHAQTLDDKINFGKLSVAKRGFEPVSQDEMALIKSLTSKPEYKFGSKVNAKKIAVQVNTQIFGGRQIRNGASIAGILYGRIRKINKVLSKSIHEGAD